MMLRPLAALTAMLLLALLVAVPGGAHPQPPSWPGLPGLPFSHLREGNNTTGNETDTAPPALAITSHKDRETVKEASVTVRGSVSDPGGVRLVEVGVNGGAFVSATGNSTWSLPIRLEEGSNTIVVRASDLGGNFAELNISIVLSTAADDNSGILLASALIIPVVALIILFVMRRKALPAGEEPDEHDELEKRLGLAGKERDDTGAGLQDSEEVTRIDERPARKGNGKARR